MNRKVLTVGFAVFTMFFGSGNMVLPLYLMQKWPDHWLPAFVGFCITAVIVTLLGLIGSVLVKGDIKSFFAPLGLVAGLGLQCVLIAIEGPFGVVPRSLIVAYGGTKTIYPELNHNLFFLFSSLVVFLLALDKNRIVKWIGNIVTPVMLIFLISIVVYSFNQYGFNDIQTNIESSEAFIDGLFEGYLTYDLPGAIYFTGLAMFYLNSISKNDTEILSNGVKASFVSAFLLISVYGLFIYLGLVNQDLIANVPPERILPTIIKGSLGHGFSFVFAIFIFLACITTAIAAVSVWSEFIHYYFPKLPYNAILAVSLMVGFMVASIDFRHLMRLLAPVLNFVYPVLIGLTIYNIAKNLPKRSK